LKPIPSVEDQDPRSGAIFTPKSGIRDGKTPEPGSGIRDEHPDLIFENLVSAFLGLKILEFFDADPDPWSGILFPGTGIRDGKKSDKHPGSATLPVPHKKPLTNGTE
jgi:hypothetical protein